MSEFNTIQRLVSPDQPTKAEDELKTLLEKMKLDPTETTQQFAAQWSQLVAWSWLEPHEYSENKPNEAQENLRQEFINAVKELARTCIQEHYCPGMFVDQIIAQSDCLSEYLAGKLPKSGLTLPNLYHDLTNLEDYAFTEELTKLFLWVVTVDRFNGWLAGYNKKEDKFVMVIAYPPRPALSPSVLTVSELRDWSQGKGDGGYTPPNPYIPTCIC
ncbi:hypothetical protein [Argonema antarcticum]|uniref:hypothetical protein n=1 Tax=Argonema antarcticum TaxID=2942763 RepID=UPI002010F29F|nr:hypothetical protein [Argonema antarcticum]MCL1470664.1 hypothetical protein [Argonema antarcticum A004/B2]